jgi:ABC-type transport system involved in multi-copper enzyme maturation permease subunit
MAINPKSVYTMAKKEFADNVRNKWVLSLIVIFVLLTIIASYLAAGQEVGPLKMSYSEMGIMLISSIDEEGNVDFPGLEPDDVLIIEDQVVYIASQYNSTLNMNVTYVWFNSTEIIKGDYQWYNSSLDLYNNFDIIIEGQVADNYSAGDIMEITLHIIEVESFFLKGEFFKEIWDSENKIPKIAMPFDSETQLPKFIIPMGALYAEEKEERALGDFEDTVGTIMSISVILIPIIAIMLGYSTIAGEAENGSLYVVLSYPVRRSEVLMGKFIGLGSVIVVSCIIGFGAGGVIIAATVGTASGLGYLIFIGVTILLGLLYLALTVMASAFCKRKVTALASGIIIFFWAMIYGMIIMGLYLGTGGSFEDFISGDIEFPDWLWKSIVLSPGDMYQMASMQAFGINQMFGITIDTPDYMSLQFLVGVMLIWTIVPMILAYIFFKRRDI